jgi:predicted nucleotidyltransferase
METLLKPGFHKILKMFYDNGNSPIHLRGISRKTGMNENSASRFLNSLVGSKILISEKSEGARRFFVSERLKAPVFSLFDFEKFENLKYSIKKAIEDYISMRSSKPLCLILYGSASRGHQKKDSDIDLLEISDSSEKIYPIIKNIESQRGVRIQVTRISQDKLSFTLEKDNVFKSAVKTGFPVFGRDFFYGVIKK